IQPLKYTSKELDRFNRLDLYDFGARPYDPTRGAFLTHDPLAEDDPATGPTAFCAANPIRFTDPTGMKIEFAPGSTKEFMANFNLTYCYLNIHNSSYHLDILEQSDKTYYVKESANTTFFNASTNTINWAPYSSVITDNTYVLSPAELLSHEADHAAYYDQNPEESLRNHETKDAQYGNKDDRRVITGSEQEVARKLGKLSDGEVTRDNHFGTFMPVDNPLSSDPDLIIVEKNGK
ncbi:MAG: hypothetical protein J6X70_11005, partial [Muribaculaceae bacterium]|nr:hypothetical protein [Muribaculaceae bacterium]